MGEGKAVVVSDWNISNRSPSTWINWRWVPEGDSSPGKVRVSDDLPITLTEISPQTLAIGFVLSTQTTPSISYVTLPPATIGDITHCSRYAPS